MAPDKNPIESLMSTTLSRLRDMIDVNTVIGEAVETKGGTVIIPISRVSVGFVTGGGEYNGNGAQQDQGDGQLPFAGGTGAGVTVQPVGFLVVEGPSVRVVPVDDRALLDRLLDVAPQLIDKIAAQLGRTP